MLDVKSEFACTRYCSHLLHLPLSQAPLEPTLTVRGYVRVLTDAGLLPAGYVAYALLAHTLPSYYLALPEMPSSRPAEETASDAPDLTSMARPRDGTASAIDADAPATEDAGDTKTAKSDDAVLVDVEATEMLLNLSLIYAEVSIAAARNLCRLHTCRMIASTTSRFVHLCSLRRA